MNTTIDPGRLARAVWLDVEPEGFQRYVVTGGADGHVVEISGGWVRCDCPDFAIRGDACKHALAVSLTCGAPDVVRALRELIAEPAQRRRVAA